MSQQRGAARMWWTYSREETVLALQELEAIGERLGGGFIVTPVRERVMRASSQQGGDDVPANDPSGKPLYQTVAWCFKHESFMPAVDPTRTAAVEVPPVDEPLTVEEMHDHFPDAEEDPVLAAERVGQVIQAELEAREVPGDPTEGLTAEEVAANRAARAGDGNPETAEAVVNAGDGRTQS